MASEDRDYQMAVARLECGFNYAQCPDRWGECNDCRVVAVRHLEQRDADRRERDEFDRPADWDWLVTLDVSGVDHDEATGVWRVDPDGRGDVVRCEVGIWFHDGEIIDQWREGPTRREVLDLLRALRLLKNEVTT